MEIQHIVSGFSPKLSSTPTNPIGKQLLSLKFPSLLSSSYPSIHSHNCDVPRGTFYPIRIGEKDGCYNSRKKVWCSSSSDAADSSKELEVKAPVTGRRKKLAVFVSGGGSNFKSIQEASKRGSLHGDVVVLVTNKSGMILITSPLLPFLCFCIIM